MTTAEGKESGPLKEWRKRLTQPIQPEEASKKTAQLKLLVATAGDQELKKMAVIKAEIFKLPFDKAFKDLIKERQAYIDSVDSWALHLGES